MNQLPQLHYKYRGYIAPLLICISLLLPRSNPTTPTIILCAIGFWLSFFLRVWARSYCGIHTRGSKLQADQLIQSGPYSHTRHPLYLSNIIFGASWSFWTGLSLEPAIIFSFLFLMHSHTLANSEDFFLHKKFTSQWKEWAKTTPLLGWNFKIKEHFNSNKFEFNNLITGIKQDTWTWVWQSLLLFITPFN
jgi:protein-S-isoprenylcysteine O-methyltransferase Ste14